MDTFEIHSQHTGKLTINSVIPVNDRETLSNIYTPNVGKICMAIKDDPSLLKKYTIAGKTVAVISDGTAVLGFGNIGPRAALPVMEGKCVIFKEFAGIDAYPICLDEQDPEKFIAIVKSLALNFAAINLEDISAPRCFDIEKRLSDELDIPIIHDDQHGTAIVSLAALLGAIKITGKTKLKIAVTGAGAAGTAITKLLINASEEGLIDLAEIKVFDSQGLISLSRTDLNKYKIELAELTKQTKIETFSEGIQGMDVFIGVSVANSVTQEHIKSMNSQPIVFALANPTPEIMPDDAKAAGAMIIATGRSDFPNQINNALAYPGVFKGLLAARINKVTAKHKIAAAKAIYNYNLPNLSAEQILPSILDKNIPTLIADEIKKS
jgi:malate dehydrogenase (oxaloacetate-decarboxylating)